MDVMQSKRSHDGELGEGSHMEYNGTSSSDSEFDDGFGEDYLGDEQDRERLRKMTDREREEEIYNRMERRDRLMRQHEICKKLKMAKNVMKRFKGDKTEEKRSVGDRKVKQGNRSEKFAVLKAMRENRVQKAEEEREKKKREEEEKYTSERDYNFNKEECKTKLKTSEVFSSGSGSSSCSSSSSSSSSDNDSDCDRSENSSKSANDSGPKFVSCIEDLERIRVSRHKMERFVHLPIFNKAVVGCFVRLGIGSYMGRHVYRIAEILSVCETAKIYQLGNTRTNKGLYLRHGRHKRVFRLEFLSNSAFEQSEFDRWIRSCSENNIELPTLTHVLEKEKDINDLLFYQFSNDDIDKMVEERARFKHNPHNYALAKTTLLREKDIALQKGDDELVNKLNEQIEELDEKASYLDKRRTQNITTISYINERNRKDNIQKAEQAIEAEIQAKRGNKLDDPFTRRWTRPTMVTRNKELIVQSSQELLRLALEKKEKEDEEKKKKEEEESRRKEEEERKKDEERKRILAEDMFEAHNFDVKIDFDVTMLDSQKFGNRIQSSSNKNESSVCSMPGPSRRCLNLQDYRKKKGLI